MIVSKEWLNDFFESTLTDKEIESGLTSLGLECTLIKEKYTFTDVYVGKILECRKHPNADKLSICIVDINKKEKLSIVCGAPNVSAGIKVPVAIVNSSLNNGDFIIKKTKIRGIESQGMICSEKELSISNEHKGIMILDNDFELGSPLEDVFSNSKFTLFELDLTPNRGDCFSHLGIARELAILEKINFSNRRYNIPETFSFKGLINIKIDDTNACLRYSSRIIKGVNVKESPGWLAIKLKSIGQNSINNIVDAANYVMLNTGHPLHTFDLDKICNKKINIRFAKQDEEIELLDNKNYNLNSNNLVIADDVKPIAIAGVMGDNKTGISLDTKNILIESAYFNPAVIRKSAKTLGLSTESSKRFERDTDIDNVLPSLDQITELIMDIANGESISSFNDIYPRKKSNSIIKFNLEKCNKFLGTSFNFKEISSYFKRLNIEIVNEEKFCKVPSYRNDLLREVDLYEEIARVFGYNNIPSNNSFVSNYSSFYQDSFILQSKIKKYLMSNGYHENYSNSLVSDQHIEEFSNNKPIELSNPLSHEMKFLRTTLLSGLLKAASYNLKRNLVNFKFFETGVIHKYVENIDKKSVETDSIAFLYVAGKEEHWRKKDGMDFFSIKGEIVGFLEFLRFENIEFLKSDNNGFLYSFLIKINGVKIGYWGEIDKLVLKKYRINDDIFGLEIDYNKINKVFTNKKNNFITPNIYPFIKRDIALEIDSNINSEDIENTIRDYGGNYLSDIILFDVYKGKNIKYNKISLAYTLKFQSDKRTLNDNEIDDLVVNIVNKLEHKYKAKQR